MDGGGGWNIKDNWSGGRGRGGAGEETGMKAAEW